MRILLNGALADGALGPLRERFGDRVRIDVLAGTESADEIADRFANAEAVISVEYLGGFPPAPKLKLFQLPISGLDRVELDAIPPAAAVCNVYEHETGIAEYVFAGLLMATVRLDRLNARFRAGDWADSPRFNGPTRPELAGRTVLTIGYGNIGQATARRAMAFDMTVDAVTRTPRSLEPPPNRLVGFDGLTELLPDADFVVICCPLSDETHGLLGEAQLAAMKSSAVLVNVARGPIVDEDALYAALRDGVIGGAVLDTWYQYADPQHPDLRPSRHPLHELDNVIMTPHLSGWTDRLMARRWDKVMVNIAALLDGGELINVVRPAAE